MRTLLSLYVYVSLLALSTQCTAENRYRVYFLTEKINDQIFIGIGDEFQKSLGELPIDNEHAYDFGVFTILNTDDIDLKVRVYSSEQRRVLRVPQYTPNQTCTISDCQGFQFVKTESPPTSTSDPNDLCRLHVTSCGRGPAIR